MEESTNRLLQAVKHYQESLEKHTQTGNTEKILHAIDKLSRLPIQVCHLEQTGVGKTVNSLKKIEGKVSENARHLVDKWKSMVKGEEEKAKQEALRNKMNDDSADDDDEDDNDSEDNDEKSLKICEDEEHSNTDQESDMESDDSLSHKKANLKNKYSERSRSKNRHKQQSKRHHSSEDSGSSSSNDSDQKSKKHKSHKESTKSSHRKHSDSSSSDDTSDSDKFSNDRKSSSKGRSNKSSSDSSHSIDSDNNSSLERKYKKLSKDKRPVCNSSSSENDSRRENDRGNSKKDKPEESHRHRKYQNSDKKYLKTQEIGNDSKKHESKKYHEQQKSSGSSKSRDYKEKHNKDAKKEGSGNKPGKENDRKSEKEKDKIKNDSDNKHLHSKSKEAIGKSESKRSNSKSVKEQRDSKDSDRRKRDRESSPMDSSNKRYKESKESSISYNSKTKEKKEHESNDNKKEKKDRYESDKKFKESSKTKSSKQDKHKEKPSKSTVKLANGIDSESGTSFADALGMLEPPVYNKSKKKLNDSSLHDKIKVSMEKPSKYAEKSQISCEKLSKPSTSTNSCIKKEKNFPDGAKLLKEPNLEPLELNLSSLLPPITPNYKPVAFPLDYQPKKLMSDDEALTRVISAKHQRTKVYSGNKSAYTKVPSLFEMCTRILQDNLDALEYTGGVPYSILKPIIEKATPDQLFQLEFHNSYLLEDTDELWTLHCQKDFRNKKREEMETAREMYMRCLDEREAKLKALTANIKQAQDKSLPVRTTKLAYVDSVAKPPRNIARKQAKNGTIVDIKKPSQTPSERLNQLAKNGEAGKVAVPNPGRTAVDRSSSSHSHSSNLKPKKAPLMAKTLSLLKSHFSRR